MKKNRLFVLLLAALFMLASGLMLGCAGNNKAELKFISEGTNFTYVEDGDYYFADYGTPVTLPEAAVMAGEDRMEATVSILVTDSNDRRIPVMGISFSPANNATYKVTYSTDFEGVADITLTLKCADNLGPAATFERMRTGAVIGDVIVLPKFMLDDPSGVDESKTLITVTSPDGSAMEIDTADGKATSLTAVTGAESFTVTTVGKYVVSVKTADKLGNERVHTLNVIATEAFVDSDIAETMLFDFNESEYERLVYLEEGDATIAVVTEGLPKQPGGDASTGGMLKIGLAEDSSVRLFFNGFKNINADNDNVGNVTFKVYSSSILAGFTVYSTDGETRLIDRKYRKPGWNEFSFNAKTTLGWTGEFEDFYIGLSCEDAVSVYIDEIGYQKLFKDTNIGEHVLADFDEDGYMDLVSQNHFSNTAQFELVKKADLSADYAAVKEGITGEGALKVTVDSSMEGFTVLFDKPVKVSELGSLTIRMYFDRLFENSRWGFITETGATTTAAWGGYWSGVRYHDGWFDYRFAGSTVYRQATNAGGTSVIGMYFAYVETATFNTTFYVDKISYTDKFVPSAQAGYEAYDEDKQLYKVITFENFDIIDNLGTTCITHPCNYPSYTTSTYDGENALAVSKNSAYVGFTYTLPEILSAYNAQGKVDKGTLWIELAIETNDWALAAVRVEFTGTTDNIVFSSLSEGINFLPIPFTDIMAIGINSITGINVSVSNSAYKMIGIYYDMAVTSVLPETGKTQTYNGETVTQIAEMGGEQYLSAFRRTGYSDKSGTYVSLPVITTEDGGEKLLFAANANVGTEFAVADYQLGTRNGKRVGNYLYIDVDFSLGVTGKLTYGVKTQNGKFVTAELINPDEGKHRLELFVPDVLDVNLYMRAVMFAGNFGSETAVTIEKIYVGEYKELLGTPELGVKSGEDGATLKWNTVTSAARYAVTKPDGTVENVTATEFKADAHGLYTVQALSDTHYSKKVTVYVEKNFGKLDESIGGYILGEFETEGADRNWETYLVTSLWGTPQNAVLGTGTATNGYGTGYGITVKCPSAAGWAAGYYALPEPLAASGVYTVGFNILSDGAWGNCQYNNEIFGVRIGGTDYLAGSANAFYRTGTSSGYGNVIEFTSNVIGNSNNPKLRVQIDITRILAGLSDKNVKIEGVFYGLNKSNTQYVDSVFYTKNGGAAQLKYDGAAFNETYYTTDEFDFSLMTASVAGGGATDFTFTAVKDGSAFTLPDSAGTLAAGTYTVTATDRVSSTGATGSVTFTVEEAQSGTLTVVYDKSEILANDTFDLDSLTVTGGVAGMTYKYTVTLPSGTKAELTDGYNLSASGNYTITVVGTARGYRYVGTVQITVNTAQHVNVAINYGGSATLNTGNSLNKSDFTPTFDGATHGYKLVVEFDGSDTDFTGDTFTLNNRGVYKVKAIVTERGYEGSAEVTLTAITNVTDLTVTRNNNVAASFKTTKNKTYDLSLFAASSSVSGAAESVKWTLSDGTDETPLDMTNKSFTFGKNGTFTIKATPDSAQYFGGNAATLTVTVEDVTFNVTGSNGEIILADFSNEGYNIANVNVTSEFGSFYGKPSLKFTSNGIWGSNGLKIILPDAVTFSKSDRLFVEYYSDTTENIQLYMYANNGKASQLYGTLATSPNKTWNDHSGVFGSVDIELEEILINANQIGITSAISRIYIVKGDITDLPDSYKLIHSTKVELKQTLAWQTGTGPISLDCGSVTLTKNSVLKIKFTEKTTQNLYVGINDLLGYVNQTMESVGVGNIANNTVVSVPMFGYEKLRGLFADKETVKLEKLRLCSYGGNPGECYTIEWIAVEEVEGVSDYENAAMLRTTQWSGTAGTAWGQGYSLTQVWINNINREINKNGKIVFCIKTTKADSIYFKLNGDNGGFTVNKVYGDYTVVEAKISETGWVSLFGENETITLNSIYIQLAPDTSANPKPNTASVAWVAYVPPAAE